MVTQAGFVKRRLNPRGKWFQASCNLRHLWSGRWRKQRESDREDMTRQKTSIKQPKFYQIIPKSWQLGIVSQTSILLNVYCWLFLQLFHGHHLDVGYELLKESWSRFAMHCNALVNELQDFAIQTKRYKAIVEIHLLERHHLTWMLPWKIEGSLQGFLKVVQGQGRFRFDWSGAKNLHVFTGRVWRSFCWEICQTKEAKAMTELLDCCSIFWKNWQ